MSKTLDEKSRSIEHIFEVKEFIRKLPEEIIKSVDEMRLMQYEYEILDYFWCILPKENFQLKWKVIGFPKNIYSQIKQAEVRLEEDIEYFQRQLFSEISVFNDHIESLNVQISSYSAQFDISKVV